MLICIWFYEIPVTRRKSQSGFENYLNIYFIHVQIFVVMVVSILAFSVDMDIGNIYPSS